MLEVDGDVPELTGHICEAVLVQESWYRGERLESAHALYLKLLDGPWHRVFFDGGILFFRPTRTPYATGEGIPADAFRYTLVDVGVQHGLAGRRITGVDAQQQGRAAELRVLFDSGALLSLRHQDDVSQVLVHPFPSPSGRGRG
ncbi:MAG: hypothetical protein L0Y66_12900 [Myxococcaceae bacterium]|nr:hypothetical protein [Myxococcaceae bacterium]MCI0673464.1 hypothetical protein [Myxococcaceae bacterium]